MPNFVPISDDNDFLDDDQNHNTKDKPTQPSGHIQPNQQLQNTQQPVNKNENQNQLKNENITSKQQTADLQNQSETVPQSLSPMQKNTQITNQNKTQQKDQTQNNIQSQDQASSQQNQTKKETALETQEFEQKKEEQNQKTDFDQEKQISNEMSAQKTVSDASQKLPEPNGEQKQGEDDFDNQKEKPRKSNVVDLSDQIDVEDAIPKLSGSSDKSEEFEKNGESIQDEDKFEKDLVEDIKEWLENVNSIVETRTQLGFNPLVTMSDLLEKFRSNFDEIYKKGRMTDEEKEEYLNGYCAFCKDIQHNTIENVENQNLQESLNSLSYILFLIDFGFEIAGDILVNLYNSQERIRKGYIREHYFAAYKQIDHKRVAIGRYLDPFEM